MLWHYLARGLPCDEAVRVAYRRSTRRSTGIQHVLVNGTFIVRDGELVTGVPPGRPVRAAPGERTEADRWASRPLWGELLITGGML